jgi:predicted Zn-ribbon and HTH transcriptional regulator
VDAVESKERIAYLKGLLDGLGPQDENQSKVYAAIVDALEALADEVEMHRDELREQAEMVEELNEFCESLEDDMEEIEKLVGELEEVPEEDEEGEDEEDFETVYQSAVCPKCGHRFYYQPELYEENKPVQCPKCAETFERKED